MKCPRCNLDLVNSNAVLLSMAAVREEVKRLRKDNKDLEAKLAKRHLDTFRFRKGLE
jgi:hypothetical protein